MFVIHANFVGQKTEKNLTKNLYQKKITQLIARHLVPKTGYEAGNSIFRLLSKASNTSFSRHIKTGCNLLVCITNILCASFNDSGIGEKSGKHCFASKLHNETY